MKLNYKRLFTALLIVLFAVQCTFAQNKNELIWSRIYTANPGTQTPAPNVKYQASSERTRYYRNGNTEAIIGPNFRPNPTTNTTQSEMSIDLHPANNQIIFGSANATNGPTVSTVYGTGIYFSTNDGTNWTNYDNPPFGTNSGDPAAVVTRNGNFYIGFIDGGTNSGGQGIAVSTNNGANWTRYIVTNKPTSSSDMLDKNHLTGDRKAGSPYEGRIYAAWTDFISSSSNNQKIGFKYSTNYGQTWSTQKNISTGLTGSYLDQGVNLQTGANGEVYAIWAVYKDNSVSTGEDGIGFNMSTDGGETWGTPKYIYNVTNFGIRGNLTNKNSIRVCSFPSMAVNTNSNEIYVVFPQKSGITPCGNSIDICMIKSTDRGNTWSNPVRVNNDDLNNSKDQYFPWSCVDQSTGAFHVVFYDSRNVSNDSAEVYLATSMNGGQTFDNIKVSSAPFKPKTINGLATGYQGDYIGVAAVNNVVYPYWCDDRTGLYQGWTCKLTMATFPLNAYNLQVPTQGTSFVSFPNSVRKLDFKWDTSSSTATYKWFFGTTANPRLISMSAAQNQLSFTAGQLDDLLAAAGIAQGDSIVGQWTVMAYRNNAPLFDSLAASNGPRALTIKRGVPQLIPFSLAEPVNNATITTSAGSMIPVRMLWKRSGEGLKYKWLFQSQGQTKLYLQSDNGGYDTAVTLTSSDLDSRLAYLGVNRGDSISGQWKVYAFRNATDSLASIEVFNLNLKRLARGENLVVYDSTSAGCIISKDSVLSALNVLGKTYELVNRGSSSSTVTFTMRGYSTVIWLGGGTSLMTNTQKDSIKAYLNSGGPTPLTKSRFIVFSEDIGYNCDRSGGTNYDSAFARSYLGFQYIADKPSTANVGIQNVKTYETDSLYGSSIWPDVLKRSAQNSNGSVLYKFRMINSLDSVSAIGKITTTYNTAVYGFDIRYLVRATDSPIGSPVYRAVKNALTYVNEQLIPVTPAITVLSPNGGENLLVGATKNITWTSSMVATVKIAYTTNNGTNWLSIAPSVAATNGTYSWTVPNTVSTTCKVKITSTASDTVYGQSASVFTISVPPPVITWQSTVTVKSASTTQQALTFGLSPNATDTIDAALGEVKLADPVPSAFDARFILPALQGSLVDFRNDTNTTVKWKITTVPGTAGYPMTISWNSATLPAGTFTLKDASTGALVNVDMKSVSSVSLLNVNYTTLYIEYKKLTSIQISNIAGWNMLSVPVLASDMSASTIFPAANSSVFMYQNGYNPVTTLDNGKGYWVRFANSGNITVNGNAVTSTQIPLNAGWNLIGIYSNTVQVSGITTNPAGIINSSFFSYNAGYQTESTLQPGRAFWVRASQAGSIILPVGTYAEKVIAASSEGSTEKPQGQLTITDNLGHSTILYTNVANKNGNFNDALPPVPPSGSYDVRYSGDVNRVNLAEKSATVQLNGVSYPVIFAAANTNLELRDKATGGKLFSASLKKDSPVTLTNSAVTEIEVNLTSIPATFTLSQNYPNPFNPVTTIKFGVPTKEHVTLTVFNQLGQKVAVLVDDEREAGYYEQKWNAASYASGVYIYELKAGSFTSVKKLLLLK
ncbi:MAG: T9SS type A sorting domain-containing protein [Ignavibacteria bacterium]|nr:T9SS type A sorting domain-containing protein [Ignavibacteria bacterium]